MIAADEESFAEKACDLFVETVASAVAERGRAFVALAGGSSPRPVYERLARHDRPLPWERVVLVAGDERDVPEDHEDRNERMIRRSLLSDPSSASARLVSWPVGEALPETVAARMETELRTAFTIPAGVIPRFDLVLLGLGSDGHTASLFPGTRALEERSRVAVANPVPSLGVVRYTLTYPVIEEARRVAFLVAGSGKAEVMRRIVSKGLASGYPAARARPRDGETFWILDRKAASGLRGRAP